MQGIHAGVTVFSSKPGVFRRKFRPDLLGKSAQDWRSYVPICAGFWTTGDVLSLGDQYFLSMGAYSQPWILLMDRAARVPLSVENSFRLCALVGFAFDCVVVPSHSTDFGYPAANTKRLERQLRRVVEGGLKGYLDSLITVAQVVDDLFLVGKAREVRPYVSPRRGSWAYLHLPVSEKTWRLLTVYAAARISPTPAGRILNFWRVFEAATTGRHQRYELFEKLPYLKIRSVPATRWVARKNDYEEFNLASSLRRMVIQRSTKLRQIHGSTKDALDDLYETRRGKAAHADRAAIEFDQEDLAEQILDAQLLRYLARYAIESSWA